MIQKGESPFSRTRESLITTVGQEPGIRANRITFAIIVPSSSCAGDFTLRVIEEDDVLELSVGRPKPLVGTYYIHKWLIIDDSCFTDFHQKCLGIEATIRNLRESINDKVTSVVCIRLQFSV